MPRGPATKALVGLVAALAAVTALTRACERAAPDPLRGPAPQVLPVVLDAGARDR